MLINFYGFYDNFYFENFYVLLVLIRCFYEVKVNGVKEVVVWGLGFLFCEFFYVDDLVEVIVFLLQNYFVYEYVNMGSGFEVLIKEFVEMVKEVVGFQGQLIWDIFKFDGIL